MDHVLHRGGEVTLAALDAPQSDLDDLLAVFVAALEHERKVTAAIGDLYVAAMEAPAYPSLPLLTWFLEEQVEEVASVGTVVGELSKVIDDPSAVLRLDRELASRRDEDPASLRSLVGAPVGPSVGHPVGCSSLAASWMPAGVDTIGHPSR